MTSLRVCVPARNISLLAFSAAVVVVSACSQPVVQQSVPTELVPAPERTQPGDLGILAGEWEYDDGAVVLLTLDEQGNGAYEWKEGRIETRTLNGRTWQGRWFQQENDREGGFSVEFSPDFSEGDGTWWYTRVGTGQAPSQKGGTFHLTRKTVPVKVRETPPTP